ALVSIEDRQTGYLWLKKYRSPQAEEICQTTIRLFQPIQDLLKIITADNGKEFSLHEPAAEEREINEYFADVYSAWQQDSKENTNGLIRRLLAKLAIWMTIRMHSFQKPCHV